jgi:hypothetical protein
MEVATLRTKITTRTKEMFDTTANKDCIVAYTRTGYSVVSCCNELGGQGRVAA